MGRPDLNLRSGVGYDDSFAAGGEARYGERRSQEIAMKLRFLLVASLASSLGVYLPACSGDADGGISDVAVPDGEVLANDGDVSGEETAPDTTEEATPDTTPDTVPDTTQDTTPDTAAETSVDATETTPDVDAIEETTADTTDTSPDTAEVVEPQCVVDDDCRLLGIIVAPGNECTVTTCVEGACVAGPRDCADADPCTVDACDPRGGCVNASLTVDVGGSRYTYCPDALSQPDALAACAARGEELAIIGEQSTASALEPLLLDSGATQAWASSFSNVTCPIEKRVIVPQCKTLQAVAGGVCTDIVACPEAFAFICERRCDDGDPCTDDVIDSADGTCSSRARFCDDGNVCTTDSCDPLLGCQFVEPDNHCIDANPCTTDTCDPETGCSNKPVRQGWDATHEILECPGQDTWAAARTWCGNNGGVLAYPTNDLQRAALAAFAAKPNVTPWLWAPLQQVGGGANPWTWTDNAGSGEPPWCAAQPDEQTPPEDCGELVTGSDCTNDVGCTLTRSFACSIDITIP